MVEDAFDVGVADVAEEAADQDQVGGGEFGVLVRRRGVPGDDFDAGEVRGAGRADRLGHVPFVQLDQAGTDFTAAGVVGQDADQVAALARAEAERGEGARRGGVEGGADPFLDEGQAPTQVGVGGVVGVVPLVPVHARNLVTAPAPVA